MTGRFNNLRWCWVISVFLVGCSSNDKEIERYIAQVRARPPQGMEPIPEFKKTPGFAYSASDRRSPFAKRKIETGMQPDLNRPKEPLESYPLDGLKLVGILRQSGKEWGLILTPEGKVYRVTTGHHLGTNFGVVVEVTRKSLVIDEMFQGPQGWEPRRTSLVVSATGASGAAKKS